MLIDWSKFTLIEARVLIPVLYIFHRTCLCESSEVLSLVHCELLWRKKHVFCALRVRSVGHMVLMAGVQGIISNPMFLYKWRFVRVLETAAF